MNKFYLIIFAVVIVVVIAGTIIFLMIDRTPSPAAEIAKASAEFKANPIRYGPAKKLIPHIKIGMTTQEVEALLGKPNKKFDDGLYWKYILYYSSTLDVKFDTHGRVLQIEAWTLPDDESDKYSGYYKLDPNSD